MNIEQEFKDKIFGWVKDNYGESEANDPSWSIDELAKFLKGEYFKMTDKEELDNIKEDVLYVASENDIKLNDKELNDIANNYRFSDAYCSIQPEDILWFINRYKGE